MTKEMYKQTPGKIIEKTAQYDPMRAMLMVAANATLSQAELQAQGSERRMPMYHKSGWELSIHDGTLDGLVGLWSCWLENRFYLGYPKPSTSYVVRNLSRDEIVRTANYFREKNSDKFIPPQREPFDYERSKHFLIGLSKQELLSLLLQTCNIRSGDIEEIDVSDELIMRTLGITRSKPVRHVGACAVGDWNYEGEYKDADKPLEQNEIGQIVAYWDMDLRQWARFYGPQLPNGRGRVWVDKSEHSPNSHHFPFIDKDGNLQSAYYGHSYSAGIFTNEFSHYNKYAPEGPSADSEAIQTYRNKFIRLATETALRVGNPRHVTIDYGFVMVPEDLEREGYSDIKWLKGKPDVREGWDEELVRGKKSDEIIMLKSGNSLVPWSTIRQVKVPESVREKDALYELVDSLLFF